MDRVGIDQSCVFASLAITADMRTGNDMNLEAARQHPDRLLAYAVPDPNLASRVRDEMQRCIDAGVRGIKFHTGLHDYPFAGPGYVPAFELADKHRLPLISHGVDSPDVLRRHRAHAYPNAHFIVAHAGAGRRHPEADPINEVAREEPNVYLDTAGSVAPYGIFAQLVRCSWGRQNSLRRRLPLDVSHAPDWAHPPGSHHRRREEADSRRHHAAAAEHAAVIGTVDYIFN